MHYLKKFILKFIDKIIAFLKKNLDLFGGTFISLILAYIVQWKNEKMQTIYTFILMLLLCIGLIRVFKDRNNTNNKKGNDDNNNKEEVNNCEEQIDNNENDTTNNTTVTSKNNELKIKKSKEKNKKKNNNGGFIKKAVDSQKPFKAIRLSQDPMSGGEELEEIIKETMKGGRIMKQKIKTFLGQLWGNKVTLLNFIMSFASLFVMNYLTFSDTLKGIEFFATNEIWIKWCVPILSAIYAIVDIFTTITKYGWETPSDLAKKAENKALEKASKLSKEQKEYVKGEIVGLKAKILEVQGNLEKINKVISNFETIKSLAEKKDLTISQEKATAYEQALVDKPEKEYELMNLEEQLTKFEEALK